MNSQRPVISSQTRSPMSGAGSGTIPKGVGAPPPPGMDPRRGKLMCIKVRMLDDTVGVFHLGHKANGQALFDEVCRHLNLLECDYFGLEFTDCFGNRCWLDKDKPILRQITNTQSDARFYFIIKFYTPNPSDLEEEYTRYLFALQIRRDLASGELLCNENTAALLSSYIVQSDCGDFSSEDYPDHSYLSSARFVPNQSIDFQKKIMENHAKLVGMSPGESDMALLETARRCDFYGIRMYGAKDVEGTDVTLAVAHMGIKVFHLLQCVSTFSWAKIRKLSFKRRKLLIKLHPESYQYYKETIEFSFDNRNECKNYWKKCVEHHAFFRCAEVTALKKNRENRFFSKGSSFRYHGRTQKELIDYVREHRKRREPFTRPLKPGLSSRNERFSRPMPFDVNSSYAAVGDRVFINGSRNYRGVNQMINRSDGMIFRMDRDRMVDSDQEKSKKTLDTDVPSTFVKLNKSTPGICIVNPLEYDEKLSRNSKELNSCSPENRNPVLIQPIVDENYQATQNKIDKTNEFNLFNLSDTEDGEYSDFQKTGRKIAQCLNEDFRQKKKMIKSFYFFEEFVNVERTAVFDLKLLTQDFQSIFPPQAISSRRTFGDLFTILKHLYVFHRDLLEDLEVQIKIWENSVGNYSDVKGNPDPVHIGELLLCSVHNAIHHYRRLSQQGPIFMAAIDEYDKTNKAFSKLYRNIQDEAFCYVSINHFLLKVVNRMLVWQNILGRIIAALLEEGVESDGAIQLSSCRIALEKVATFNKETKSTREGLVNYVKLIELEKYICGAEGIIQPNRKFLREGWILKWSRCGLVPRILILFNDCLLFAFRSSQSDFTACELIELRNTTLLNGDAYHLTSDPTTCVTLKTSTDSLLLSANSTCAKEIWREDLVDTIALAKEEIIDRKPKSVTIHSSVSSEDFLRNKELSSFSDGDSSKDDHTKRSKKEVKNTTLHISWQRRCSFKLDSFITAVYNQMSGYLHRKLRNSSGWQKLWVIHSNLTLFFYGSHQDTVPLTMLPLADYCIALPSLSDHIDRENVFKLSYRKNFYFFAVDNFHTFSRWLEVIQESTLNISPFAGITSLLSSL